MTTFHIVNNCNDLLLFETPSRSRKDVTHTVAVCKRTGRVSCSCEDSVYRGKGGDLLDPLCPQACWHVRRFAAAVGKVLARALGKEGR